MSALCDPYDMGRKADVKPKGLFKYLSEEDQKAIPIGPSYTRQVLERLRFYDQPFTILTKGGMLAAKDFDLYTPQDKFGVTLTFDNPEDSRKWEPGAALPEDRIAALKEAHTRGIQTWVSMEPVIYPQQNLNLIKMTHEFVDFFFIDRLNRNERKATWIVPKEWPALDWSEFRTGAEALLQSLGKQPERDYMFMREEEEF
jgi:DNA repair photolyase